MLPNSKRNLLRSGSMEQVNLCQKGWKEKSVERGGGEKKEQLATQSHRLICQTCLWFCRVLWTCVAANGTDTQAFADDFTVDRGNRVNAEVNSSILCSDPANGVRTHRATFRHPAARRSSTHSQSQHGAFHPLSGLLQSILRILFNFMGYTVS